MGSECLVLFRLRPAGEGGDSQNKYAITTEEESNIIVQQHQQQRGQGGEKIKNSTNRDRGSISKAMDRVAESIESGGGDSGSNMMISMLSM
jgi:hypothetical protein